MSITRLSLPSLLLVALSLAAPHARAASGGVFPFEVQREVLDNGLTVYAIPTDSPGIVAYYSVVRTGSRNEVEPGKTGFAHFFEHMMFHGTEAYPPDVYNDVLKRLGADSNAWTWDDQTTYHIVASSRALPKLVELEADRFQHLSYDRASFQKEARAVLGEYNKSAANPEQKMIERLRDLAWDVHPYEHTTMGFLPDIEDMPNEYAYSKVFFSRWYRPDNVTIVVAGDVTPDALFALVKRYYGAWERGGERPPVPTEPPQTAPRHAAMTWPTPTQPRLMMAWKVPGFEADGRDAAALDVLDAVVFSERSALYRELVVAEQWVQRLDVDNSPKVDPRLFYVTATVKDAARLPEVEAAIEAALAKVGAEGVDEATLDAVRSHVRYAFARRLGTADGVASTAAWYVSLTGTVASIDAHYRQLAQVTSADLQRVVQRYFQPRGRTVVTLTAAPKAPASVAPASKDAK